MPRRRSEAQKMDVNMTPLLDVVLQLITFFMMLVHFSSKMEASERAVRLPVAPAGLPSGVLGEDRMTVTIDAAGALEVGTGESLGPNEAADWWAQQARLRREGRGNLGLPPLASLAELPTRVLVRADKDAPYGSVRAALSAAQDQGFAHFSLVVLRSED